MQGRGLVGRGRTPALPPSGRECPPACTALAKRASLRENERSLVVRREEPGMEMERMWRKRKMGKRMSMKEGRKRRDKDRQ
ncbi:hypothetical protein E2C01_097196 [Portunus trituberculatus]|uniref:Uncharacterized protein n=1 Tax=Portunus trituberculatus TaxID=210409 RepID=A0A5B7K9C0_PORTR|nr:hypothetical protein [Portunus trituberculatus]